MRNLTIKKGTRGLKDDDFLNHCDNIITALSGNVNFPNVAPLLPDVGIKIKALSLLIKESKSIDKSPRNTLEKNLKRKDIERDMSKIFHGVQGQGISDLLILTSSGFPLEKTPESVASIGQCQGFVLLLGPASGECLLKVKKLKGAKSYMFQYTETLTPEINNWVTHLCSNKKIKLTGIKPGVRYTFRVCGIRKKEMGPWSDYITRYIS